MSRPIGLDQKFVLSLLLHSINPFLHHSNVQVIESLDTKEIGKGIREGSLKENLGEVKIETSYTILLNKLVLNNYRSCQARLSTISGHLRGKMKQTIVVRR